MCIRIQRKTRARIWKEINGKRDGWKRKPKSSDCNPLPLLGHTKEYNIMSARIRGVIKIARLHPLLLISCPTVLVIFLSFSLLSYFLGISIGGRKKVAIWAETISNLKIRKDIESIYGELINNGIKNEERWKKSVASRRFHRNSNISRLL